MISITEYKKLFIDRQGKAPAILLNKDGEALTLGDVHSVTRTKGRVNMKWKGVVPPDQWEKYTHIALMGDGEVQLLEEITPITFDGKPRNVEVTFYER